MELFSCVKPCFRPDLELEPVLDYVLRPGHSYKDWIAVDVIQASWVHAEQGGVGFVLPGRREVGVT